MAAPDVFRTFCFASRTDAVRFVNRVLSALGRLDAYVAVDDVFVHVILGGERGAAGATELAARAGLVDDQLAAGGHLLVLAPSRSATAVAEVSR